MSHTLAVSASGSAPRFSQWYHNGEKIAGATSAVYVIATAVTSDTGSYACVVTNTCGAVTSAPVSVVIRPVIEAYTSIDLPREGSTQRGAFTISRTQVRGSLVVRYRLSGQASNGVDYATLPNAILLVDGIQSVEIPVEPFDDPQFEGTETVVLTLLPQGHYCISPENPGGQIGILDDEVLTVVLSTSQLNVREGTDDTFDVTLNYPPITDVTVAVSRTSGDTSLAISGDSDHVFGTNNWNVPKAFTLAASQDTDSTNGVATFTITGTGLTNVMLRAVEMDDDPPAPGVLVPQFYGPTNATGVVGVAFSYQPQVSVYSLTHDRTNWTGAEGAAAALGGHLVTINSSNEQSFLQRIFMTSLGDRTPYWIGLNDAALEGTFRWASGDPLIYTNWNTGEPNNVTNQDYVAVNLGHALTASVTKGTWSDTFLSGYTGSGGSADGPYRGILELPLPRGTRFVATNLPTSFALDPFTGRITGVSTSAQTAILSLAIVTTNGSDTQDLALTFLPFTYNYWLSTFSGVDLPPVNARALGDDPDGDGLVNAAEYAFNLRPMTPDLDGRPRVSLERIFSNKYLLVTYRQHRWASEVSIIVQRAPRVDGPWSLATIGHYDYRLLDADTEEFTMIVFPSIVPNQSEFLKVSVELREP